MMKPCFPAKQACADWHTDGLRPCQSAQACLAFHLCANLQRFAWEIVGDQSYFQDGGKLDVDAYVGTGFLLNERKTAPVVGSRHPFDGHALEAWFPDFQVACFVLFEGDDCEADLHGLIRAEDDPRPDLFFEKGEKAVGE